MAKSIAEKRAAVGCKDYKPLPRSAKCQHYAEGGACKRDDYFMCVEWLKANPDYVVTKPTEQSSAPDPMAPSELKEQLEGLFPERQSAVEQSEKGQVYDLTTKTTTAPGQEQHMLKHPELLTEAAVASLAESGLEVDVKTADDGQVTLVKAYTDSDRAEISYEHARALVLMLQIFPGSTLETIRKPPKAS